MWIAVARVLILRAWMLQGETGYPWIDACMRQLRREGWLHHVGRNAVACFLTRGDLWINWEKGLEVCGVSVCLTLVAVANSFLTYLCL